MLNLIFDIPFDAKLLLALCLPFMLLILMSPRLIAMLRALKAGQPIRQASLGILAPEHQGKVGTPTMGGILIIGSILLGILLYSDLSNPAVHCCLLVTMVTAGLGLMDDYQKITKGNSDGVSGKIKIAIQAGTALVVALYYYVVAGAPALMLPFFGPLDIGWLFIPLALLVIIGSSNAVNLTDGLDGLASGCCVIVALTMAVIFGDNDLSIVMVLIASACLGFLWFNCYPAKIFMGDTGSLALGALLGTAAVCSGSPLYLLLIGSIFAIEALSVMLQVGYFKYSRRKYGEGRRLLRMAPIHHHFEKKGWSETQVCVRFWTISLLSSLISLYIYFSY